MAAVAQLFIGTLLQDEFLKTRLRIMSRQSDKGKQPDVIKGEDEILKHLDRLTVRDQLPSSDLEKLPTILPKSAKRSRSQKAIPSPRGEQFILEPEVARFLEGLNLSNLIPVFTKAHCRWRHVREITRKDLKAMKIAHFDGNTILEAVSACAWSQC